MVDFTFGIALVSLAMGVFLAICFSLIMIELSQYISFASSRAYFAGDLTKAEQMAHADRKFDRLLATEPAKTLLGAAGWFQLKKAGANGSPVGNFSDSDFSPQDTLGREIFEGAKLEFRADILDMSFPFVGGATEGPFTSNLYSFIGREPSTMECINNFYQQKTKLLENLGYVYGGNTNLQGVYPDNGC